MIKLNDEQKVAVDHAGNVFVQACPGSGKTRVLTARIIRGLEELPSSKHRVVGLTFTNRAADEIQTRLDRLAIPQERLWAGTIHSFALEWILRPYAGYLGRTRNGFSVADEYFTDRQLTNLRQQFGKPQHFRINTTRDRLGVVHNPDADAAEIFELYNQRLVDQRLLDYDDVLFCAYQLLVDLPEIPQTLGAIIHLICVDEIQDTQDLQFGILSAIFRQSPRDISTLFFVGDPDQCIYESLGAVNKSVDEISDEFGRAQIAAVTLNGNYRSIQRIIDFYQLLRPGNSRIESLTNGANQPGLITFHNQTVDRDQLPALVAEFVLQAIGRGVPWGDICVLAPHWTHIRTLSRTLSGLLPDIDFDAPGSSALHSQRENFWFRVARLFLTTPTPSLFLTRLRWAREVINDLKDALGDRAVEPVRTSRQLLRLVNSIKVEHDDGLGYLEEAFSLFCNTLNFDLTSNLRLNDAHDLFFQKARERIARQELATDIQSFKKLFKHPAGVVISTCHSVKGEEYDTVIAFGLLQGYIPNWEIIINGQPGAAGEEASRLLYVICSRAKRCLHLISESGHRTRRHHPYETTRTLEAIDFDYDLGLDIDVEPN